MKYNYKKLCASFTKGLPQRTSDIIERRFGLRKGNMETLEAIGATYSITRERVRQIESEGFLKIKPEIKKSQDVFKSFNNVLSSFGGVKKEQDLLEVLGGDKFQNHALFLLANGDGFKRVQEDDNFYAFWSNNKSSVNKAKNVVKLTITKLKKENRTFSLNELSSKQKLSKNIFASYIGISKNIKKNPEGNYGLRNWLEINPKGVKDKAYLVFKKQAKPLHFSKVASMIENLPFPCEKKVHTATVHNELIKDNRFVLVGRGLYALKEWGYEPGIVKDIIAKVLKDSKKPLTKQDILKKVLEQRFVKENTVAINLQDRSYFLRDNRGKYKIA